MSAVQWTALLAVVVAGVALASTVVLAVVLRGVRGDVRRLADASRGDDDGRPLRAGRDDDTVAPAVDGGPESTADADHRRAPTDELEIVPTTPLPGTQPHASHEHLVTRESSADVVPSNRPAVDAPLGNPMIRAPVR